MVMPILVSLTLDNRVNAWSESGDTNIDETVDLQNVAISAANSPDDLNMVFVLGGDFFMGDHHDDGDPDETPVHAVYVSSFYLGRQEITNQQYCDYLNSAITAGQIKLVDGAVYSAIDDTNSYIYCDTLISSSLSQIDYSDDSFRVRTKSGRDMSDDPMVRVSWFGAAAYCNWRSTYEGCELCYDLSTWDCDFSKLGYRLPTEAEWEYAARGGEYDPYYRFLWGDTITHSEASYYSRPWKYFYDLNPTEGFHPSFEDWIYPYTAPVGSFPVTGYCLNDMTGNAWEWCNDWYDSSYYNVSPYDNPTGLASGDYRVLRGGSWISSAYHSRVAVRYYLDPNEPHHYIGFRPVLPISHEPVIYYVDADAIGDDDGSSWADAYNFLQDALVAVQAGDEIRVAQGAYRPDEDTAHPTGTDDRNSTFQLVNGVALYGGYAGFGSANPDIRDPNAYLTVLSGDLNGNDVALANPRALYDDPSRAENSYHVLTGSGTDETAVIDGFTITAGNANGPSPDNNGGGMYNHEGSSTVINCVVRKNSVWAGGGGMYNSNSHPRITNCLFSDNLAGNGGGMANYQSNPALINCIFNGNSAEEIHGDGNGGGLYNDHSSPILINCTLVGNRATNGRAMACTSELLLYPGSVQLHNCILWNGGNEIWNNDGSTISVNFSDVQEGYSGQGNIQVDPGFIDPGSWDPNGTPDNPNDDFWVAGDYRLQGNSPCMDAGDNNAVPADTDNLDGDCDTVEPLPWDFDGNPRFFDNPRTIDTGNGIPPIVDMGAYEAQVVDTCTYDIDGDGAYNASTDGILILRYLFGFRGADLCDGVVSLDDCVEIEAYLQSCCADGNCCQMCDVDGNGDCDALTDGMLIIRYMFGFRGSTLCDGAIAPDATRNCEEIETFLESYMPD